MNYIELAKEILEQNYDVIGVRTVCDDENYEVGEDCRESYDWDVANDCSAYFTTNVRAGGTCATHIDIAGIEDAEELAAKIAEVVAENAGYGPGQQVVIAGNDGVNIDMMLDPGEVRIWNAFVIAVL